tara:strand:+ start:218 stop:415 length:198 start_codon:yes stop_codon:yes gene_type:complete
MNTLSKAYEAAIEAHDAAILVYHAVRDQYRAMKIEDEEFLAARAAYHAATVEFDEAFSKETGVLS